MATNAPNPAQLAARLLYLSRQEKLLKAEKDNVKAACEQLFAASVLAAKTDHKLLFSDNTEHNVRLNRQGTGTYFKVSEQHKEAYDAELKAMQQRYIAAGCAEMAEKEMTWVAKEVKA
jgi:phosphoribosylformylglycinamidine (FGAM) synthase PurS component